jgi:hypothetical protein
MAGLLARQWFGRKQCVWSADSADPSLPEALRRSQVDHLILCDTNGA